MRSLLLGGITILFLLIGCSGKIERPKNTIYYNLGGEPTTLSPLSSSDAYSSEVQGYVFDSLLTRDLETYEWKPVLATEWSVSKDKKIYEFKLREGVKWSDGKDFTAEDVKYSFDVIFSDKYKSVQYRSYYEGIKEVQIVDKYKVRYITRDDYFLNFDIAAGMAIIPKHFYEDTTKTEKDLNRTLIGTGVYMIGKYDKGQKITLVKNPYWWGKDLEEYKEEYRIDKIVLRFISEENVYLELLKKGDLDFNGLRNEAFMKKTNGPHWEKRIVKVKTENKTPKPYNFIGWNYRHKILKDREVRKALGMLVNRPFMIQKFEYGMSELATGPVYVQSDYANPNVKPVEYNPKEALKVLRNAGWKDSDQDGILDKVINGEKTNLSITILEPNPVYTKYLTIYKEDARKVGVEINIKPIEWNSFVKLLDERNFEAVRLGWSGGSIDWDPKQIWHSSSASGTGSNFIGFENAEVDRLIDASRRSYDREERIKMLRRVHEIIANDYPYVFFFNNKYTVYAHNKRVQKPRDTFPYGIGQQYWVIK